MTDEEWETALPGQAVAAFKRSTYSLAVVAGANDYVATGLRHGMPADMAALIDRDFQLALFQATPIIASVSIFEAYVEDFFKAVMTTNWEALEHERILAFKGPAHDLPAPEGEGLDKAYRAMKNAAGKKPGVGRYEDLLRFIGLSGDAPDLVKVEFYNAQAVRHVWAHNAGIADDNFVRLAPYLGYSKGDLVDIGMRRSKDFILANSVYGMVIANRYRKQCGLDYLPLGPETEGEGAILKAFRDFYNSS
ncbi:hypothetical protein [Mycobacterium conspicuum]|uniref:Uncharacterized protein n=1 Tax=Mycobacterium conspicuum TaxID=44010 RepID=A0A1X1TNR8_9MYCO|nr:hypothetical protein [Mycobacterium conspicuum]ORV46166.1 hypothetical protein AWC00_04320 [Mycobacterium conspicuum]BBZ37875.1 hypothetical protein MCNS_09380 [Mycobacterium conspicuum]